jgi:hypothetical protein
LEEQEVNIRIILSCILRISTVEDPMTGFNINGAEISYSAIQMLPYHHHHHHHNHFYFINFG